MNRILFRCDASLSIGSGHVIRCRSLARVLRKRGALITFLCRRQPGDLIGLLNKEFQVIELPEKPLVSSKDLVGRELYAAWLGCSQERDADDCFKSLEKEGISAVSWVVVDHYGLDACWEAKLFSGFSSIAPVRLLAIDDLADRAHNVDILLDQNYFGESTQERYSGLLPQHCAQMLGPHYALLSPEYAHLAPLVPFRREIRRVLVFFGGVDAMNLTSCVLTALSSPEFAYLAVDVVLGLQSPHLEEVEQLVAKRPYTTFYSLLPSLAGLIARADLALGAVGATTWERACLGLHSLVVTIAENQLPCAEALDKEGYLQLVGSAECVGTEDIRQALEAAIGQPLPQSCANELTDGWGCTRIACALLGLLTPLCLRLAMLSDEALLLRWANDPLVRANSCSPKKILLSEHQRWFRSALEDSNIIILIACDGLGCPVGQIRFERQLSQGFSDKFEALIGLSLDRCVRGQGLSAELVRLGLEFMEIMWGPSILAVAEIFSDNYASQATFARNGFVINSNLKEAYSQSRVLTRWLRMPVL